MSLVNNIIGFEDWMIDEEEIMDHPGDYLEYCHALLQLTDDGYKYVCEELTDIYERFREKGWKEEDGFTYCNVNVYICVSEVDGIYLDVGAHIDREKLNFGCGCVELSNEEDEYIRNLLKDDKDYEECCNRLGNNNDSDEIIRVYVDDEEELQKIIEFLDDNGLNYDFDDGDRLMISPKTEIELDENDFDYDII